MHPYWDRVPPSLRLCIRENHTWCRLWVRDRDGFRWLFSAIRGGNPRLWCPLGRLKRSQRVLNVTGWLVGSDENGFQVLEIWNVEVSDDICGVYFGFFFFRLDLLDLLIFIMINFMLVLVDRRLVGSKTSLSDGVRCINTLEIIFQIYSRSSTIHHDIKWSRRILLQSRKHS